MKAKGFFEIRGTPDELLPKLCGKTLKSHGFVYFADFSDGTIKIGMTRGIKARIKTFSKTAESYGKPAPQRFGISPVLANHETIEKLIHKELSRYWVERELFRVTENLVDEAASNLSMEVLRSCMWPACHGYFNHYGKESVKPRQIDHRIARVFLNDSSLPEGEDFNN